MDKFVYIAMTGAREAQTAQAVTTNNLANASTTGFRAELASARNVALQGPGFADARAYAVTQDQGTDLTPGTLMTTGRDLDVAVDGPGWIAVQAADGTEGYTRAGNLRVDSLGQLTTATGENVLGDGGPIALPPFEKVEIGVDGSVSIRPQGQDAAGLVQVARIRLVNPPGADLQRGADGLLRPAAGAQAPADASVRLVSGALEGSNVNTVTAMVEMIQQARNFEMQVKMMNTAEVNDRAATELMRLA